MTDFKVKAPDGSIITVRGPEGATEAQAIEYARANYKPESIGQKALGALGDFATLPRRAIDKFIPNKAAADVAKDVVGAFDPFASFEPGEVAAGARGVIHGGEQLAGTPGDVTELQNAAIEAFMSTAPRP